MRPCGLSSSSRRSTTYCESSTNAGSARRTVTGMARDAGANSRTGRAPTAVDAAIALTMGVYAVLLPTAMTHKGLIWQDVVVTLVCVLALWQLRRWPYAAMAVICAATTLSFAMGWDGNLSPMAFTYAVIVFAVGSMS